MEITEKNSGNFRDSTLEIKVTRPCTYNLDLMSPIELWIANEKLSIENGYRWIINQLFLLGTAHFPTGVAKESCGVQLVH